MPTSLAIILYLLIGSLLCTTVTTSLALPESKEQSASDVHDSYSQPRDRETFVVDQTTRYKRDSSDLNDTINSSSDTLGIQQNSSTKTALHKHTLQLLIMVPYSTQDFKAAFDGGYALIPAARLAAEQINNRTDILQNFKLELVEINSACSEEWEESIIGYTREVYHRNQNIVGIVGPACTNTNFLVETLGSESDKHPLVQITVTTSHVLRNKTRFPNVFATISSSEDFIRTIEDLAMYNNWKNISVVHFGSVIQIFSEILQSLQQIESVTFTPFVMLRNSIPLNEILRSELRVIVVLATAEQIEELLCSAYTNEPKLSYPDYQWILVERSSITYTGSVCRNRNQTNQAFEGAIFLQYKFETLSPENITVTGQTYDEYFEDYKLKVKEYEKEIHQDNIIEEKAFAVPYANLYYDAVWAFGLSLDKLSDTLLTNNRTRPEENRLRLAEGIKTELYGLESFNGVSGEIKFGNNTEPFVYLYQAFNGNVTNIGFYNSTIHFNVSDQEKNFIPDSFQEDKNRMALPLAVFLSVMNIVLLISIVFFHILNITYRHHKDVKATSPRLNHIIFFGCYLVLLGILMYIGTQRISPEQEEHTTGNILCSVHWWLIELGYTLMLATLCAKTWRIYRIFIHFNDPGNLLSDPILLLLITLLTLPTLLSLVSTLPKSVRWSIERFTRINNPNDMEPHIEVRGVCAYLEWQVAVTTVYKFLILSGSLCLSLLSRHVVQRFRTVRSIGLFTYCNLLIFALGFSLYFIATRIWPVVIQNVIFCFIYFFLLLVSLIFLFIAPVIPLLKEKWRSISMFIVKSKGTLGYLTV